MLQRLGPTLSLALLPPGAVILLGRTNMFRFNHPKEAARLREKRKVRLLFRSQTESGGPDGVCVLLRAGSCPPSACP